ncbi:MAG: hypothetical protein A3E82_01200 [Gammaproteobacteria bacterium RIFCSPHIGHO2_12_FULL_38_11]|nr:MAG: hypothetical protein A3E82_01200 [Gammaproteobacteria bacterium RIFCSPHIGHO2_12_FULL_38_11]
MNSIGKFLLVKERNAIITAFICALLSVFNFPTGIIAVIIVGLITLQRGPKSGLWLLAWIALPPIALFALRRVGLFDVLLFRCIFMWVFAVVLRRFHAWGLLLEGIALFGVVLIILLHLAFPNLQAWWKTELLAYINPLVLEAHSHIKLTAAQLTAFLVPMATGIVFFYATGTLILQLIIARFWQYSLFNPGAFAKEFIQIRVSIISLVLVLFLLVFALFKKSMVIDAFPSALLPFFIAGLSLMHFFAQQKKHLIYVLILMYLGLFFLPAIVVSVLSLFAFTDVFFGFRKWGLSVADHH